MPAAYIRTGWGAVLQIAAARKKSLALRARFGDARLMLTCIDAKPGYLIPANQCYTGCLLHLTGQTESPA